MQNANSCRAAIGPIRTARVRLPATASVAMSRMLLANSTPTVGSPTTSEPHHAAAGIRSSWTYAEPVVATKPKKTSTMSSPRPR